MQHCIHKIPILDLHFHLNPEERMERARPPKSEVTRNQVSQKYQEDLNER